MCPTQVIVAIPNVIGALCLNGPGLAQFNVRQVLDHYFAIFSSDQHVKVLLERDNGNVIGAAFDELIRHHPSLKDKILKCCITVMQAIKVKGEAWMAPAEEEGYHLKPVPEQELVTDAQVNEMLVDSVAGSSQIPPPVPTAVAVDALAEVSIKPEEPKENIVLSCVDIMGRVSITFTTSTPGRAVLMSFLGCSSSRVFFKTCLTPKILPNSSPTTLSLIYSPCLQHHISPLAHLPLPLSLPPFVFSAKQNRPRS